jgi:dipeptidyl-peptidase-3
MKALISANGFMQVSQPDQYTVVVRIDRDRIRTDGAKAISELATNLHIILMSADRDGAKELYEPLTAVDEQWLAIRDIAVRASDEEAPRIYVQANTKLGSDGRISIIEYDATPEGVIQSWMDRDIDIGEDLHKCDTRRDKL